jgi:hypothetical protein
MAWENRHQRKRYYYRGVRRGERVVKLYCGNGPRGAEAAQIDLLRRLRAQERKEAFIDFVNEAVAIESLLKTLAQVVDAWLHAELVADGWEFHKSQWRRAC